jgi:mRNA-degrading endonuclease RelE of RelBE toxin-antitoxin system
MEKISLESTSLPVEHIQHDPIRERKFAARLIINIHPETPKVLIIRSLRRETAYEQS